MNWSLSRRLLSSGGEARSAAVQSSGQLPRAAIARREGPPSKEDTMSDDLLCVSLKPTVLKHEVIKHQQQQFGGPNGSRQSIPGQSQKCASSLGYFPLAVDGGWQRTLAERKTLPVGYTPRQQEGGLPHVRHHQRGTRFPERDHHDPQGSLCAQPPVLRSRTPREGGGRIGASYRGACCHPGVAGAEQGPTSEARHNSRCGAWPTMA